MRVSSDENCIRFAGRLVCLLALLALACASPDPGPSLEPTQASEPSLLAFARSQVGRRAYSVSIFGTRIGYSIEETRLELRDGQTVVVLINEMRMQEGTEDELSESIERSTETYRLDGQGALIEATSDSLEDGLSSRVLATVVDGELLVQRWSPAGREQRLVPLPRKTFGNQHDFHRWLQVPPQAGENFVTYELDWALDDGESVQEITYHGQETVLSASRPLRVSRVTMELDGLPVSAVLDAESHLFQFDVSVIRMQREDEAIARDLSGDLVDMMSSSMVSVAGEHAPLTDLVRLTLELRGTGDFVMDDAPNQSVLTNSGGTTVLELHEAARDSVATSLSDADRLRFLSSSPTLQSEDPAIVQLAGELTDASRGPLGISEDLSRWIYLNLEGSLHTNASTARDVLQTMSGDCTEHTLLFVALARAAGVPARPVGGLRMVELDETVLAWHQWAEIHDGNQWLAVDPSWNEIALGPTNIRLSVDDELGWASLLGSLSARVVSFERR